jgi:HK97 family phage portal protein
MAGKHTKRSWFARTFAPDMVETKEIGDFPFDGYDSVGMPLISFSPGLVSAIRGEDGQMLDFSGLYRTNANVYTVVDFLAWQLAQIGIKAFEKLADNDRRELPDDGFKNLMRNPAPGLTYFRLIQGMGTDLGVYGNAYWLKMGGGDARALMPLPPFAVTPQGGTLVQAARYTVDIDGVKTTYPKERIVHFRFPNPVDMRVGLSPLAPLRAMLMEDTAATAHRQGFWTNAARMEGLIMRPKEAGPWGDAQRDRFRQDWQNVYAGSGASGKTAILEDSMTWSAASFSPKESEFIEGRKQVLEAVCRAYNVPISVLGLTQTATFASQKEFHRALYQDTLGPYLQMIADEIEAGVLRWFTDDPDTFVEHTIAEKLRGSFEEQADAIRAYVGVPIMSVDEGRKLFNLPAMGEEFAEPIKPLNVAYAGQPGEAPMPEQNTNESPALRAAQMRLLTTKAEGEGL